MIIGIDIYHKKIKKSSCVGIVASMNQDINKFYSRVILVPQGKQLVTELGFVFKDAISTYFKQNKNLPTDILIYRDGISESQTKRLFYTEVSNLIDTFPKIHKDYSPKLAYILVNKRVNHKFFTRDKENN